MTFFFLSSPSDLYKEIQRLKSTLTFFQPSPVSLVAGGVVTMDTIFRSQREMDFNSLIEKVKSKSRYNSKTGGGIGFQNSDMNIFVDSSSDYESVSSDDLGKGPYYFIENRFKV